MDIIDSQSFSSEAQGVAQKLIQKHGRKNFKAIEKEVKRMMAPKDFVEEILWAVKWILQLS